MENQIKELFRTQKLAVLATQSSGAPYANLVAFASSEDATSLWFVTERSTRKYQNLSSEPRIALMIDNRSNDLRDFGDATAVTALGRAVEIEEPKKSALIEIYLEKHPNLKGFATSPSSALFKVDVEVYIMVSAFENVSEWRPFK